MTPRFPLRRRDVALTLAGGVILTALGMRASAQRLPLSEADAAASLKAALEAGLRAALSRLGAQDGFLGDPDVRITLPGEARTLARLARRLGLSRRIEDLETGMNRAAEAAISRAAPIFRAAAARLTIEDGLALLSGGDTALTEFFRKRTEGDLRVALTPLVAEALARLDLVRSWNSLVQRLKPLMGDQPLEAHVTRQALEGLFHSLGEEERALRQHPERAASALIRRVFKAVN
jgi:hypothetical protein